MFSKSILTILVIAVAGFGTVYSRWSINNHGDLCSVSAPCNASLNLECVDGACACKNGYSTDRDRNCRKSYGQSCAFVLDCNIDRTLGCSNNICSCQKPLEQVFVGFNCVSLLGHNCDHSTGGEFSLNCVPNAFCDMPIINGSMVHRCTCNEGYEPNENKFCRPKV